MVSCVCGECSAAHLLSMWNRSLARILALDIFPSSIQFLDKPSRTKLREYTCTFLPSLCYVLRANADAIHLTMEQKVGAARIQAAVWLAFNRCALQRRFINFYCPLFQIKQTTATTGKKSGLSLAASPSIFRTLFAQSMCHFCRRRAAGKYWNERQICESQPA